MARDPARIDRVLAFLGAYWKQHPDLRLTQLLQFVTGSESNFYFEDDDLESVLENLLKEAP